MLKESEFLKNSFLFQLLLLGVMSEHSMPFSCAPILIDLARALADDPKALAQLSMDRCTASYKTTHGLARGFQEKLINKLKHQPFSLNIDESTAKNNKHVLTVLVSFYDTCSSTVVCEHFTSVELTKVDSESIYTTIADLVESNDIPWTHLVSILMDSCNVMRGKKAGVETRLRQEKAPHLMDIDGDSCHHLHNSCKKLCAPFDAYLEDLFTDLYNDFKWSSDLAELMTQLCEVLGLSFTKPERFISHRWLAAYDLAMSTEILFDAFQVFYYGFLGHDDKALYKNPMEEILVKRKVTSKGQQKVKQIHEELSKKKMTDFGKDRKKRINTKLFYTEMTTQMQLAFYQEVLPTLKAYVMTFQSSDVMVHQLHDRQIQTFTNFLACFVKAEVIAHKSPKQLQKLNLDEDEGKYMKMKDMYVGPKVKKIMKDSEKNDTVVDKFLKCASAAYINCAKHMQAKLPLNSKTLQALSCVDPLIRNNSEAMKGLQLLSDKLSHLLTEVERTSILREITNYGVDVGLHGEVGDVVQWWTSVSNTKRYPALCKIVFGALSIFHGPMVESSFNIMGDVIGAKTASLKVETYSAIQTVKYALKSRKTSAVKLFRRKNPVTDPVDKHMCIKIRAAAGMLRKSRLEKVTAKKKRLQSFGVNQLKTKSNLKKQLIAKQDDNFSEHVQTEAKRAKKRLLQAKLEILSAKRKKLQ